MANLKFCIDQMNKKIALIASFMLCQWICSAQTFSIQANHPISSQYQMVQTTDYGYLVIGEGQDTIPDFHLPMYMVGYDHNGTWLFQKEYYSDLDWTDPLVDTDLQLNDSTSVIATSYIELNNDTVYARLHWINLQGDTLFTRKFSSPYFYVSNDPQNYSYTMFPTSLTKNDDATCIYMVCQVMDYPPLQNSFILLKLTNTGELIWTYHQPFDDHYYACNAVVFHDGNPWLGVAGWGAEDALNKLILIDDSTGVNLLEIEVSESSEPEVRNFTEFIMDSSGVAVSGYHVGQGSEITPAIYKMDYSGNYIWYCEIPNGYNIEQYNDHLVQAQDGGFVCAAVHYQGGATPGLPGVNNYVYRTWLWKVDADGNFLWDRKYEYLSLDSAYFNVYAYPHDLKATPDGGFIVAGEATATCSNYPACDAFIQQGWLLKVDGCGCLVPGCDESCVIASPELNAEEKTSYFLYGPNPIEDALHIYLRSSTLLDLSNTTLSFYDQLGRRVHSLSLAYDDTTYIIDTHVLSIGEYIMVLEKDGQILQSEKLMKR
jgi:hypothetical protein